MDPDVAHPRHQSNQTVRNRGEEGWQQRGGSLSPGCRAAFFLRWSRTQPPTSPTSSTPPPRFQKSAYETSNDGKKSVSVSYASCRLIATLFISSDDTRTCVMGTFQRGEKTSCWCFLHELSLKSHSWLCRLCFLMCASNSGGGLLTWFRLRLLIFKIQKLKLDIILFFMQWN